MNDYIFIFPLFQKADSYLLWDILFQQYVTVHVLNLSNISPSKYWNPRSSFSPVISNTPTCRGEGCSPQSEEQRIFAKLKLKVFRIFAKALSSIKLSIIVKTIWLKVVLKAFLS